MREPQNSKAAVHAVQNLFDDKSTEAILLVDATNAFNTINCQAALHNIRFNCPTISNNNQFRVHKLFNFLYILLKLFKIMYIRIKIN